MAITITPDELRDYGVEVTDAMANRLIEDAIDQAEIIAPGISSAERQIARSAAAVIRGAIVRWIEQGGNDGTTSTTEQVMAGPFSQMNVRAYQNRTTTFLPSEERKLALLGNQAKRRVFAVDLASGVRDRSCGLCPDGCLSRGGHCGY